MISSKYYIYLNTLSIDLLLVQIDLYNFPNLILDSSEVIDLWTNNIIRVRTKGICCIHLPTTKFRILIYYLNWQIQLLTITTSIPGISNLQVCVWNKLCPNVLRGNFQCITCSFSIRLGPMSFLQFILCSS